MKIFQHTLNPIALIASAITAFILGFIWYSYLFQAQWVAGHGFTAEKIAQMGSTAPIIPMAVSFIGYLVTAAVISYALAQCRVPDLSSALSLTTIIWVGFTGMMTLMTALYAGTNLTVVMIDAGYQLLYSLLMTTIIYKLS
jgi:hypothetical protein